MGADGVNNWVHRAQLVYRLIREQQPDLVALQEVLPNQRQAVEEHLPEWGWWGRGRNHEGEGEQCTIGVARHLQVQGFGTFWLSQTPDLEASLGWDACLPRICSWVRVEGLTFANVHLDHLGHQARCRSARLLCQRLEGPLVLAGDFNCEPRDEPMMILRERLQDGYGTLYPDCELSTYHEFGALPAGPRIDYVLTDPEFSVRRAQILTAEGPPYPSDHHPVVVELSRGRPGS